MQVTPGCFPKLVGVVVDFLRGLNGMAHLDLSATASPAAIEQAYVFLRPVEVKTAQRPPVIVVQKNRTVLLCVPKRYSLGINYFSDTLTTA